MAHKSPNQLNYNEFKRALTHEIDARDMTLETQQRDTQLSRELTHARFYQNVDSLFDDSHFAGNPRVAIHKALFKMATFCKVMTNNEILKGSQLAGTDVVSAGIPQYRLQKCAGLC